MKVKILTSFPKKTIEVGNVFFSSDLHLNHQAVLDFGRNFNTLDEMSETIYSEINTRVGENDMLVLLGDTMMVDKDYVTFLTNIKCKNVIMLFGNHCNIGKLQKIVNDCQLENLIYIGYYVELIVDRQIICCSHYPMFNWNYQDEGSFSLHGHLHGDENKIIKEIHKYKSMDVGVDSYYNLFGEYRLFSYDCIKELMKDKLIIGRH